MLAGLKHLVRENLQDVVENSYLNCHAKGVHSFMINEYPGKSIRVFVATPQHELWKNHDVALSKIVDGVKMSVAFHTHRRNLVIETIRGTITNVTAIEDAAAYHPVKLKRFEYKSKILDDKMGFVLKSAASPIIIYETVVLPMGASKYLPSKELHTIVIPHGQQAAWLVYEGMEDATYQSDCFSNADLDKESDDGLYQKPTMAQTMDILGSIGLY